MYLTPEENATMLGIIRDHFDNATVMMECLAKKWVNKEDIEESIQKTGAKFILERIVLKIWEMLPRDSERSKTIILHEA